MYSRVMSKNKNTGFTLVELLVSLFIFSVVMIIVVGLVVVTTSNVRKSRAQRRVMDNVAFAMEHLSRSLSYGKDFACGGFGTVPRSCPVSSGGDDTVTFSGVYAGSRTNITFTRRVNPITGYGYIARQIAGGSFVPITDDLVDIEQLTFYISHAETVLDTEQPMITIVIRGTSYATTTGESFVIQTTVSQRDLKL
jgi:prepilin-type N-terminal cleavage/methylation domain-containing protein